MIKAIIYAEFHNVVGAKIEFQWPEKYVIQLVSPFDKLFWIMSHIYTIFGHLLDNIEKLNR
jgi:hypothetical protein